MDALATDDDATAAAGDTDTAETATVTDDLLPHHSSVHNLLPTCVQWVHALPKFNPENP